MTLLSATLYATIQLSELGAVLGIAVAPAQLRKAISQMKLKEALTSPHAAEKIIWVEEDPFEVKSPPADLPQAEETLKQAKAWLLRLFRGGEPADCPCCGQRTMRYSRSISGPMVKALEYAAKSGGATPKKMSAVQGGGDYGKLVYWGFLIKSDDGKWRATEQGRKFLRGDVTAAKYIYLFNNTAFGRSEEQVFVSDCLKGFQFAEIFDAPQEKAVGEGGAIHEFDDASVSTVRVGNTEPAESDLKADFW